MERLDEILDLIRRDETVDLRLGPNIWLRLESHYGSLRVGKGAGNSYPAEGIDVVFMKADQDPKTCDMGQVLYLLRAESREQLVGGIEGLAKRLGAEDVEDMADETQAAIKYDNLLERSIGWYIASALAAGTGTMLDSLCKNEEFRSYHGSFQDLSKAYARMGTAARCIHEMLNAQVPGASDKACQAGARLPAAGISALKAAVDERLGISR